MPISRNDNKPLTWTLQGAHLGDNLQVKALADALGWPQKNISLQFNGAYRLPNFLLGSTLKTLKPSGKSQLQGPWPDLVIGAGRRSAPVARWIKARSGGRCRLVQLGRPRAALRLFDLVVTTPQYDLPDADNVIQNLMPLSGPVEALPDIEIEKWQAFFSRYSRPWTGVLVGGSTWPFVLDAAAATDLKKKASRLAASENGSLLIACGPRTSPEATAALVEAAGAPAYIHRFDSGEANPYSAMLALCNSFIVTGDSVSMISEACKTGKPVYIFDVPRRQGWGPVIAGYLERWRRGEGLLARGLLHLAASGVLSPPRNVARFHEQIIQAGHATWLGSSGMPAAFAPEDELAATVRRVRELFVRDG